jgi:hypothetical protein
MAIIRVCLRADELITLVNRIQDERGYVAYDQFMAGLQRLERTEVTDKTVFDALDEQHQSGYWPPMGRWPTALDGKDVTSASSSQSTATHADAGESGE